MTIRWVVFDLGNVVLQSTTGLPRLARLLGVDEAAVTRAYYDHRIDYDLHSDAARYFTAMSTGLGVPAPDETLIAALTSADDVGWSATDPETLALVTDLDHHGVNLAVLSNAPSSMGRLIEAQGWAAPFRHLIFSGDLGVAKPDVEIYRELLERLGAEPAEVAFLDDRTDNIEAAVAAGIHGLVFTGAARARNDLRALGLPV